MAANPILPLYYNDIDRSTRDWTDEEFGCYMRLLMHQWAQGEIPKETQRLSRIVTSLGSSWVTVGKKFIETETGMINEKLEKIREERLSYQKKQLENGKKGGRKPKENPTVNPNHNPNLSLHNEDENEIEYEIENRNDFGKPENLLNGSSIIPTSCRIWYNKFPTYTKDQHEDFSAMQKIIAFMCRQHTLTEIESEDTRRLITATIEQISEQVSSETFWVNKPLKSIANNIQEFYNRIKNPVNGKPKQKFNDSRADLQAQFDQRYGSGR
jgi:uncharacterized protein YdaU (DUF1376 family)